jgi:hypothetical protein
MINEVEIVDENIVLSDEILLECATENQSDSVLQTFGWSK